MTGISGYGTWVPYFRMKRENISGAWGMPTGRGERAVANFDEDSVSMAVNAGMNCLPGNDARDIDALFFATTTAPYREKGSGGTMAAALGLRQDVRTIEMGGSLRSGIAALITGFDLAAGGKRVLVTSADCRLAAPQSAYEQVLGDGGCAFLLDDKDVIAEIEHCESFNQELQGYWRGNEDKFLQTAEDRFSGSKYAKIVVSALGQFATEHSISVGDFQKVIIDAPTPKLQLTVAKMLGLDREQLVSGILEMVGHTGAAAASMMLAKGLSEAKSGDRILVVAFGEGCDIVTMKVTDNIAKYDPRHTLAEQLAQKDDQLQYTAYLKWRGLIDTEPPRRPETQVPSQPALYRNNQQNLGFEGCRCTNCGTAQFPKQRVCVHCRAKDEMEEYSFRGKDGKVVTFTADYLAASPAPPSIFAVVDFDGGGRMLAEVTDCPEQQVKIGERVQFTFRRLYSVGGVSNYFWKAVPKRGEVNE
ncbi:OB-fold domain-containing protein [Metallumcola ferriviriculae]|uniref:OB-fold domain-containing protein n=1 Tax=Metallumcola ferriviriculae TaxID=3039180 RepID=A0AAU0UQY5_9FIRM|nr:OB-fold domain-containing protein [Desulfitibacteraceae bacterium MK1]